MDYLDDIPTREDAIQSDDEKEILREYFGNSTPLECTVTWAQSLKISGYAVLIFAILGNPWVNNLIYMIPQLSNNPILAFCIKLFIFMFTMLLIAKLV